MIDGAPHSFTEYKTTGTNSCFKKDSIERITNVCAVKDHNQQKGSSNYAEKYDLQCASQITDNPKPYTVAMSKSTTHRYVVFYLC